MSCRAAPLVAIACALSCGAPEIMSLRKLDGGRKAPDAAEEDQPHDASVTDSFFVVSGVDGFYDVVGAGSQVFCPGQATTQPPSCAALGVTVDPAYADKYTCFDLGPVPGVPPQKYGGLTLTLDKCSTRLLIGGEANYPTGKLYGVNVVRDDHGHVSGFPG